MLQREVAERISAAPGDMSYLSVFVQYHAAVRIAFPVPREAFEPAPDVESAVVEIRPIDPSGSRPRLSAQDEDEFWGLVQAGFRERRKKLHNSCRASCPCKHNRARALAAAGIDGDRRPQHCRSRMVGLRVALGPLPEVIADDDRWRLRRSHPRRPVRAAKLNLTLAVVGQRSDGYHALHSIMVPLSLAMHSPYPRRRPAHRTTPPDHRRDHCPAPDNLVLRAIAAAVLRWRTWHDAPAEPPPLAGVCQEDPRRRRLAAAAATRRQR